MTIMKKMDNLIKKLESNDPKFIEKLNKDFEEFTKKSDNGKGKENDWINIKQNHSKRKRAWFIALWIEKIY